MELAGDVTFLDRIFSFGSRAGILYYDTTHDLLFLPVDAMGETTGAPRMGQGTRTGLDACAAVSFVATCLAFFILYFLRHGSGNRVWRSWGSQPDGRWYMACAVACGGDKGNIWLSLEDSEAVHVIS